MFSILLGILPALLCITLHELSHGFVAYRLGDDTAMQAGRLSFNPLRHIDPIGMLMMLVFRVGWAKPVPVNMYRFKNPKAGMAVTAAAGPISNLIIAAFFLFFYGLLFIPFSKSGLGSYLLVMIELTAYMSIGLAVFNVIPVPPLDGSKIVFSLMSDSAYFKLMHYERYVSIVVFALFATGILSKPVSNVVEYLCDLFFIMAEYGFELSLKLFM